MREKRDNIKPLQNFSKIRKVVAGKTELSQQLLVLKTGK